MNFKKFLIVLFCLCCVGCRVKIQHESDDDSPFNQQYKDAYGLLMDGDYDGAIASYEQMLGYLDSEDLYYEAIYRRLVENSNHYLYTMENWQAVEDDYLMLSYNHRNEKMLDQQGLYLQLLTVASHIYHKQDIDCTTDFYYYTAASFWDNYMSCTVLNSEELIGIVDAYLSEEEACCLGE